MKILSSSIAAALLAVAATGCGSGSNDNDMVSSGTPATAPETSSPATDAFTATVSGVVGMSSDSAEPIAVDASASDGSDTAEPVPVS